MEKFIKIMVILIFCIVLGVISLLIFSVIKIPYILLIFGVWIKSVYDYLAKLFDL